MKYGRLALVAYAFTLSICVAAAESIPTLDGFLGHTFPDNTDVRKKYWTNLITAPKEQVWTFTEKILPSAAGQVRVRSIKRAGDFLVEFTNSQDSTFTDYSQGSYVIARDSKSGYILQAKVFLGDDPGCYVRLYPQAEGTRVDVVMYGAVIKRGLYVTGLIYYILAKPFSDIVGETRKSFDWARVFGLGERSRAEALAMDLRAATSAPSQASSLANGLPSLVTRSSNVDALIASITSRGQACVEMAPAAAAGVTSPADAAAFSALALSDDRDPLVPGLPYRSYPRYEAGKGLSLGAVRSALYLDYFSAANSAYALVGDNLRVFVTPYFDASGHYRFAFFVDGREASWDEIVANKDKTVRVIRITL